MNAQGRQSRISTSPDQAGVGRPAGQSQIFVQLPKPLSDLVKRVYDKEQATRAIRSLEAGFDLARVARNFRPELGFVNGDNRLVSTRLRMDVRCQTLFTQVKTTFSLKNKELVIAGIWHAINDPEGNLFNYHWRQMREGR
jgi:hypothetical protein